MGSYEDAFQEHESCGVFGSKPDSYLGAEGSEKSGTGKRDRATNIRVS